jgi:DNA-binding response OmpR family regulator
MQHRKCIQSILVVDGDEGTRLALLDVLKMEGFRVCGAPNGSEALALAARERFDIAVLDAMLPDIAGVDMLTRMRRKYPAIHVLIVSAFATISSAVDAMRKGARDYLPKPLRADDLVAAIRRAMLEATPEPVADTVDMDGLFSCLSSPIRRSVLRLLSQSGSLRLMEMTSRLEIDDHTKMVFHLRSMAGQGLVFHARGMDYTLSPLGKQIHVCMEHAEKVLLGKCKN